ncbi:Voltage-dependent anion-selective channel protein 1 [Tupaia chinensis]|uniref:Non-selective voltage-gated ion channel VDAC1 n=1 Tax=Tupaia chinensis TaxID=246437 RepID=L9L4E6_TUPCH|nr:Voltage-dependent anion-selective channel protein 1 [Tupaia chinensis]
MPTTSNNEKGNALASTQTCRVSSSSKTLESANQTGYKREHTNLGCDVDFDIAGPSIRGALVLAYEGWLGGYQMHFESVKSWVIQSNFAVGYKTDEFQLHANVNDGTEFGGSIYQKVNKKLETAVNLAWTAGNSNMRFGIAAKYQFLS